MTKEELERLRPSHVSMGAMRVWYYAKRTIGLALVVLLIAVLALQLAGQAIHVVEAAGVVLVLGAVLYFGVLLLCFARFTLRGLMLFVFLTGVSSALFVLLGTSYKDSPVLFGVLLVGLPVLVQLIEFDPERQAKQRAHPEKPPDREPRE